MSFKSEFVFCTSVHRTAFADRPNLRLTYSDLTAYRPGALQAIKLS